MDGTLLVFEVVNDVMNGTVSSAARGVELPVFTFGVV